jgi:hypothetical protein
MCPWMQCTTFGNRVDISGKAGASTVCMHQKDGTPGIKYNGLYLMKHSLSKELIDELDRNHQIFVPFRGITDWDVDPEWSWGTRGDFQRNCRKADFSTTAIEKVMKAVSAFSSSLDKLSVKAHLGGRMALIHPPSVDQPCRSGLFLGCVGGNPVHSGHWAKSFLSSG